MQPMSTVPTSGTFPDKNLMSCSHKMSDTSYSEVKGGLPGFVVASSLISPHPKGLLDCYKSSDTCKLQSDVTFSLQPASMASNLGTLSDNLPGSFYKTSYDSHFEEVTSGLQFVSVESISNSLPYKEFNMGVLPNDSHSEEVMSDLQPASTISTSGALPYESIEGSSHKMSDASQSEVEVGLPGCCKTLEELQSEEVTSGSQLALSMASNSGTLPDKDMAGFF